MWQTTHSDACIVGVSYLAETAAASDTEGAAETAPAVPVAIDVPDVVPPQNKNLAIDVTYGVEVDDIAKGVNDVVALSGRHGGQIYERTINITDDRSSSALKAYRDKRNFDITPEPASGGVGNERSTWVRRPGGRLCGTPKQSGGKGSEV